MPSKFDMATYEGFLADADLEFAEFVSVIVTKHWWYGWDMPRLWAWLVRPGVVRTLPIKVLDEASSEELPRHA